MKSLISSSNWFANRKATSPLQPLPGRDCRIEPLEARIAPAAIVITGTGGNDHLVIHATGPDSGTYQLTSAGVAGPVVPFTGASSLTFDAGDGTDVLTINNPAVGLFAPADGITYHGGGNFGDALEMLGGTTTHEVYNIKDLPVVPPGGAPVVGGDGEFLFSGANNLRLSFTGLAPIVDTVVAASLTVNSTDGGNAISITNAGVAPRLRIAVDAFEPIDFDNKAVVIVNGGDGAAGGDGADTILVNFTNTPAGLTSITINADEGDDTINVQARSASVPLTLNGGASTTADALNVTTPAEINIFNDLGAPANVTINAAGTAALVFSSFERSLLTPGNGIVNVRGDNNGAISGQTDSFIVIGRDTDSSLGGDTFGNNEFSLLINGSSPIDFRNVNVLNVASAAGDDDIVIDPYADTVRNWGIVTNVDAGVGDDDLVYGNVIAHPVIDPTPDGSQATFNEAVLVEATLTPGAGSITVPGAVTISFQGTEDLSFFLNDTTLGDADTLTIRTPDSAGAPETVTVRPDAAGNDADPVVDIDATVGVQLLQIENLALVDQANSQFFALAMSFEARNGNDTFIVTPSASGTAINVDGGNPSDTDTVFITGTNNAVDAYTIIPGATPDAGTINGTSRAPVNFTNTEAVRIDGGGGTGADSVTFQGTSGNNAFTLIGTGADSGTARVDAGALVTFTNLGTGSTLNLIGLPGDDHFSVSAGGLAATTTINVNGGDPTASDTLIVNGTAGNDAIGYTPSSTLGAGTVTRTGAATVNFTTIEHLNIDGQGGTDGLTFTSTNGRRVTYTPGSAPDSGLIEAANFGAGSGLVPLSFAHIGATGTVNLVGAGDILQLNGTSNSDTFNVTGSTAQIFNTTAGFTSVLLNLSNIFQAELRGLDGGDTFNVTGDLAAIIGGILIDGGNSSFGDTVNLEGATGALAINPANPLAASLDNVSGFGSPVSLTGVERLNVNAVSNPVTLSGTSESEDLHVTLNEIQAATITKTGAPLTIHTRNTTALSVEGGGGDDTLTLHGTSGADVITVVKGSITTVGTAGLGLTVSAPAATLEAVRIDAGAGADTVNVSGTTNNGQGLEVLGGSPTSNAGAVADTLTVTMSTAGTTALVPGATPDAGAITSPDGTTSFGGIELISLVGAAGANTLNLQGTHASDTMAVQFLGGANRTWINDRAVAGFASFATVNVNGLFGDDKFSIAPTGLVGVTTINVGGGDPTASDELVVTGTAAADIFTFTGTSASAGAVALAGAPVVNFTTTENLILDGQAGADTFLLASARGRAQILGGEDSDTINFTGAASGVIFDLDAVGVAQSVNPTGEIIVLGDVIENFIGTAFNDVLRVKAAPFARTVFGGVEVTLPPGDTLIFDGAGAVVNTLVVDANTGTFKTVGYADVAYDEFESKSLVNSPSGPGGFGTPGNSDAFSTAHVYDSLLFKIGGKPAPGKTPTAVATGDLNGDGFADMVVANSKSKNISVLINLGDGTFLDPVNLSTGKASAQDVVLGDFDGDGNLDAVISLPTVGAISFFKGDGAGSFAAPTTTLTPKFKPFALATGDVNGDGDLDVVAVARATNTVAVITGNGAGVFAPGAQVKTLGKNSTDVVVADFNGDGDLDVATANVSSNNISFMAGDGTGALGAVARFATGTQPTSLSAADLDSDGDLDLAVSNAVSRFVTVLLGNGAVAPATQFAPQLRVAVPGLHQSSSIVTGDFDGDGIVDLGLGNRAGVNFTVLRGLGAGAYSQPYEFNLGKDIAFPVTGGIALADFNNDGLLDIVATSIARSDIRVLLHKA